MARMESGELSYRVQPFDARTVVQRIVKDMQIAHPELTLTIDAPDELPDALGDAERNWQILTNLVSNALKFSEGDPQVRVRLRPMPDEGAVAIAVSLDPRLEISGTCSTAAEAVAAARELQPALVILDHFIDGDVMGLEAAPAIKEAAPNAAVLLFTSHDLELEASREPAVDQFLLKREISELMPTVRRLLGLEDRAA